MDAADKLADEIGVAMYGAAWDIAERVGVLLRASTRIMLSDLTRPATRDYWCRWLSERGHDAHRYREEPAALAWCVRSVNAGGGMLAGIDDVPRFIYTTSAVQTFCGATLWWTASPSDRDFFVSPDGAHHGWYWLGRHGSETGDDATRAVCAVAINEEHYALREPDGTLRLPPLPEGVKREPTGRAPAAGGREARAWLSRDEYAALVEAARVEGCTPAQFVLRAVLARLAVATR